MKTRLCQVMLAGLMGLGLTAAAQAAEEATYGWIGFFADSQIKLDEPAPSNIEDERDGDGFEFGIFDVKENTVFQFEFTTTKYEERDSDDTEFRFSEMSGGGGLNYAVREQSHLYWMVTLDARQYEMKVPGRDFETGLDTGIGVRIGGGTKIGDLNLGAQIRYSKIEDTSATFLNLTAAYQLAGGFSGYASYKFGDYKFEDGVFGSTDSFDIERSDFVVGLAYNFKHEEE